MRNLLIAVLLIVVPASVIAQTATCTKVRDEATANGRVCIYNCMGERRQSTIERHQRCPKQVEIPSASEGDGMSDSDRDHDSGNGASRQQEEQLPSSGRLN